MRISDLLIESYNWKSEMEGYDEKLNQLDVIIDKI